MDKARKLAILGMTVSALLAVMKITVGWLAHSASVTADGFESAADVVNSGLVLVALIIAARPADDNHPYGHGRAEILTGLLLGLILFGAGVAISWHGLRPGREEALVPASYAIWPLVISIYAKSCMLVVKYRHGREIGSSSLMADAANDGIDVLSGIVALAALSITLFDPVRFLRADHYGAFAVGIIVLATGIRVMYEASMHLMDTMPGAGEMTRIREAALGVHDVAGVEKCFARKTGLKYHVDLHLEVDPEMTVRASHEVATQVRERIRQEIPWVADVLVHVEPSPERVEQTKKAGRLSR
jgi:cation diffusion facilitator family transporter